MIRVKVELISARTGQTTLLAMAAIANDGKGSKTLGNYDAAFTLKSGRVWRESHVEAFPRTRKNVWWLIRRLLSQLEEPA